MPFYLSEDCSDTWRYDRLAALWHAGELGKDRRFWRAEWLDALAPGTPVARFAAEVVVGFNSRPGDEEYGFVGPFDSMAEGSALSLREPRWIALLEGPVPASEICETRWTFP